MSHKSEKSLTCAVYVEYMPRIGPHALAMKKAAPATSTEVAAALRVECNSLYSRKAASNSSEVTRFSLMAPSCRSRTRTRSVASVSFLAKGKRLSVSRERRALHAAWGRAKGLSRKERRNWRPVVLTRPQRGSSDKR